MIMWCPDTFCDTEYAWDKINRNWRITNYLLKSLINMDSLSDFWVRSCPNKAETQMMKSLGKIMWSVCEILILHETNNAADNTVKVIFYYKLFTAMMFLTFLKSIRVNCYVEFQPEHSPMFSSVLHSHVTLFHAFALTRPFKILTPSGLHSLSAAFPCQHHTHHINHGHIMPMLSWNHLGTFWAVTERHQKYYGYI